MKWTSTIGVMAAAAAMHFSVAESTPKISEREDLKDLATRWQESMAAFDVPGLVVAVVKDGKPYAIQGWGMRDLKGTAPDADTKFYIASITKTYTATAICKLASEGKISLSDPVVKYLPRFKLSEPGAEKITIQDLLCHAAGIDCGPAVWLDAYTGEINDDRYFALLAKFGKASGKVDYSNIHFTLLGRVIEAVTGKPWREYLREEIFLPAGMTRTSGFMSDRGSDSNFAAPMYLDKGAWKVVSPWKTDATMHAAGGLDTTASDLSKWICLFLHDGRAGEKQVLKPDVAPAMLEERAKFEKPDGSLRVMTGFGEAWQLGTYKGHPIASHGGGYEGASAYVLILPKDNAGFAVLINSSGLPKGLGDTIAIDLLERLTGEKAGVEILESMTRLVKKLRERGIPVQDARGNLAAGDFPGGLVRWAGEYRNADFGTLRIAPSGGGAEILWGAVPLDVSASDGGFAIKKETLLGGGSGLFVLKGGAPASILIHDDRIGDVEFERTR